MKLFKWLLMVFVLLVVAGFTYIAVTDIPVEQTKVTKTISNERFFGS